MKIAITGGSGFLGKHLIEKLKEKNAEYIEFDKTKHDLTDPQSLENLIAGRDVIVHLAAVNLGSDLDIIKTNVLGTMGLLESISRYSPGAHVIYASSFQVYLKDKLYGLSKKFGEELLENYANRGLIRSTVFRITNMYGPKCKPFYNSAVVTFAHQLINDQEIAINGSGEQTRDYVYVSDVVDAIMQAIQKSQKTPHEIMDICTGKRASLKEVIQIMEEISGKRANIKYNTAVSDKPWNIEKDYQKAHELLGWEPTISLKEGLERMFKE